MSRFLETRPPSNGSHFATTCLRVTVGVSLLFFAVLGGPLFAAEPGAFEPAQEKSNPYYFPSAGNSWKTVTPQEAGWDAAKIDAALEFAKERKSSGVIILHRGRIMTEKYWELDPKPTPRLKRKKTELLRVQLQNKLQS